MKKKLTTYSVVLVALLVALPAFAAEVHYANNPVEDSWIVEVEPSVGNGPPMHALANGLAAAHGGQVGLMFNGALRGFVLHVPDQAITGLANHPLIRNLVQDEVYYDLLSEAVERCYPRTVVQHPSNTRPLPTSFAGTVQTLDCTHPEVGSGGNDCIDNWGLNRVGEENPPLDYRYQWAEDGASRWIYVLDTGVRASHREFENFIGQSRVFPLSNPTTEPDGDFYGHGTHVAAIAAGRTYGVAKSAFIYDVKVFENDDFPDPKMYLSWMLSGLQAISDHLTANPPTGIAVLNWSGANFEVFVSSDDKQYVMIREELAALLNAHDDLLLVQSAGNHNSDACLESFGDDALFPDVFDQILIVAGSDTSDQRLSFSNKGPCVDLFAPAEVVVSAFTYQPQHPPDHPDDAFCQLSGTSQAAPHVSGAAAVLSGLFPSENAVGIRNMILSSATPDVLDPSTLEGSPNLLLAVPASDGVIFDDDFAGLGNWPINATAGNGQNLDCPEGYCASINKAADTAYLGDTRPDDEYVYRVAFQVSPYAFSMGPNSRVVFFRGLGAGDTNLFEIYLIAGQAGFGDLMLGVDVPAAPGTVEQMVEISSGSLLDPTLQVELEWVSSAFSMKPTGFLRFWSGMEVLQDIELSISRDDLPTFGMTVESALLGIVSADGSVNGELRFSEFRSRRGDAAISF